MDIVSHTIKFKHMQFNKTYLRLYILTKVKEIQEDADHLDISNPTNVSRAFELQGKLELLKEIFEDLNLEHKPDEKVIFHDQI